ncbi:peptide-methionine (S)-S-oxide reductase MsrA [Caldimonas sp. KR1-144]|uniref:peptide-methionine (S)-S-oxide reductase MsrA n=1 Tax=Caldimonas sp. KR1-144 TaxID=3400911 RepID=UPI003C0A19D1
MNTDTAPATEIATLAGGCFWCTEAVYLDVDGVVAVESGYSNGHAVKPSYEQVCRGDTGHAEVVRVSFDPARISFRELLEIFFVVHDPTTLNRQGNDVGTQYRSGIYTHSDEQTRVAREVIAELEASGGVRGKVVTEVEPERNYWRAEAYHQNYFAQHPEQGYCAFVVAPKVEKFRKTFKDRVRR